MFDTAGNIINDAAIEMGVSAAAVTDPFGSTDPNYIQLCKLLKGAGQRLVRMRNWVFQKQEYVFTTVAGTDTYDMPPGFRVMLDQTGWIRTTRLPLGGPLDEQEWQYLVARLVGVTFSLLFRPRLGAIQIFPAAPNTPGGMQIAFEYLTDYWIYAAGAAAPNPNSDTPSNYMDLLAFDSFLMVRALKLDFLLAKGFDSTSAQQDYDQAFNMAVQNDSPAKKLMLDGRSEFKDQILDVQNVPVTGFGS